MNRCLRAIESLTAAWLICAAAWPCAARLWADEPVDYLRQIKPVLRERCYACHGPLKQKANLRLDTAAAAIRGGDSGPAIEPQNAGHCLLLEKISATDESERMPPEGEPLSAAQISHFRAWIDQGAKSPADEQPERDPRDHWAFRPPVRPAVPQVADALWNRNPIDAFIAAQYERRGLAHQPAADRHVWLRRVCLDLVGLPPTRAELDAFLADESPQAYETVVARLLDSPQYGERWGRHWMDIWRYSDWWGLGPEVRNSQKHLWHWRDWIIESLNADKGYDQMLREMLAADELYPTDADRLRATGFLARQYFRFNRTSWLDETIEHTSKAMLGLTFNCAKCHDHKYDPIAQTDYYRLRAVFEPYQVRADVAGSEIDFERDGIPRAFDCNLDAATYLHIRGDDRNPDKSRAMEPAVPAFLSHAAWSVEPVALPPAAFEPGLRPGVVEAHLKAAEQQIAAAQGALETARQKLTESEAADTLAAQRSAAGPAGDSRLLVKDDFAADRPELWEPRGGKWAYGGGKLVQSQVATTSAALRLKQLPPEDFEVRLRFRTTGGETWKSVGIVFDIVEPAESLAYLSAFAGGPKSQVCYKTGADYTYPPEAAQARKVELNQEYELTLRVRGALVNLLVDGELSVAYELPPPRRRGALQIIAFDAAAEFVGFELMDLPADLVLTQGKIKPTDTPQTREQARLALAVAEQALAVAELGPAAIRARSAAQIARHRQPPADDAAALCAKRSKRSGLSPQPRRTRLSPQPNWNWHARRPTSGPRPRRNWQRRRLARCGRDARGEFHAAGRCAEDARIELGKRRVAAQTVSADQHRPALGAGQMADRSAEPAARSSGRQSRLDAAFRPALGADRVRLWPERHAAEPPGTARLAGRGTGRARLEPQAPAPLDRHLRDVSPVVFRRRRRGPDTGPRCGEPMLLAGQSGPHGGPGAAR